MSPLLLLVVDGTPMETDLDGDGKPEIVVTGGTPPVTTIFQFAEGRFQEANLNRQLNAGIGTAA